jgi:Ca2+-binding RTX toxin-like protein
MATFNGTINTEVIFGTDAGDVINGNGSLGGYDQLFGNGGNDTISGSADEEDIYGGEGNDVIYGNGAVNNTEPSSFNGVAAYDILHGDGGNDKIYGGAGTDSIRGGTGNDTIYGNGGLDVLWGDDGDDLIYGGSQRDQIFGGNGKDTIYGNGGSDLIDGGAGADVIWLGSGDATVVLTAGQGPDTINNFQLGKTKFDVGNISALSFQNVAGGAQIKEGANVLGVVSWTQASVLQSNVSSIFV